MMRTRMAIGAALPACFLWWHAGPAQAERVTIAGIAGTITLDWQASLVPGYVGGSGNVYFEEPITVASFTTLSSGEAHQGAALTRARYKETRG